MGIIALDDEHQPTLKSSVSNSHEQLSPNMDQTAGHLHPPTLMDICDDDDRDQEAEKESEDEDEVISDPGIPDRGSEGEGKDEEDNETLDPDTESEPELDFGPARPTDNEDAVMLQRLLAEKRAPLGTAFRELAIRMNDKKRGSSGMVGMASSYLDQDTSGTYDPSQQRRHTRPNKRNRPHSPRVVNGNNPKNGSARNATGRELEVTFKFKKESSLNYLRSITLGPASSTLSSIANNSSSTGSPEFDYENSNNPSSSAALALVPLSPEDKKRRKIEVQAFSKREDGLTLKDLTEGHPQRRGCKACFLSGNDDCSFMDNHSHYPCIACDDASVDCELIVPPILKKSCERCKRRRITCSYKLTGGRGVGKCDACDKTDEPCCAAPLDENSAYSKRFTGTTAISVCKTSPAVSPAHSPAPVCKRTKQVGKISCKGKMTAIKKDHQMDVLKKEVNPRAVNSSLTKESKTQGSKKQRILTKSERFAKSKHSRLGSLVAQEQMDTTDGIRHRYIETAFSHPIIFNHEPPEDNTDPCSWCTSLLFGMWGHGEVKVEVIPYGGIQGNEEIGHGHYNSGRPQSKMCVSCTMARVRITTCKSHKINTIDNIDARSFSASQYNDSLQALHAGDEVGGKLAKTTKWCSICTSVADFSCCQPNPFPDPDFVGCGLNLCKICHWTLGRVERGVSTTVKFNVMDQLVKLRKKELYNWKGDDVRADSEFLRSDGEMMVRFGEGM